MRYAPYSFSKIHTFFECQKKFEFSYVNKIEIDDNFIDPIYFRRGRFLHAYIADRLKGGDGMTLKGNISVEDKLELIEFADISLEHEYISMTYDFDKNHIEQYISLDNNLNVNTSKSNSCFSGYIDYYAIHDDFAIIVDWKTGKFKENPNFEQLELYAIWLFQKYPEITEIDLVFFYAEHNKFIMKTITPDIINSIKNDIMDKIKIIENTNEFLISETKQCLHCPFCNTCMDQYDILGLNNF